MVPMLREGGSPFPCDLSLLSGSRSAWRRKQRDGHSQPRPSLPLRGAKKADA